MILDAILEHKYKEVAEAKQRTPLSALMQAIDSAPQARSLSAALTANDGLPAIIAEVKKASPSAGSIAAEAEPVKVAQSYQAHGASALSVLTDAKFFNGCLDYLKDIHHAVDIPVLRKDFIVDPYQIYEARAAGADAVLLIVAALSDQQLHELRGLCAELHLDALVEVHDEQELERALRLNPDMLGINNRNLYTFNVDVETSFRLASIFHAGKQNGNTKLVSESGITEHSTLRRLADAGFDAALIGTAFMKHPDPGVELGKVLKP